MRLFSNIFSIFIVITLVNGFKIKNIFQKYHIEDMKKMYEEFKIKALEYSKISITNYEDVYSKTQEQFFLYKKYFICTAINKLNQSLSS